MILKHKKKQMLHPFLEKKGIFRKLPDNWAQKKTQNDNCVCQKSLETTICIG